MALSYRAIYLENRLMDILEYIILLVFPLSINLIFRGLGYISLRSEANKKIENKLRNIGFTQEYQDGQPFFKKWSRKIESSRFSKKISARIKQAYLPIGTAGFLGLWIGALLLVFFIIWAYLKINFIVNGAISFLFVWAGSQMLLNNRKEHYINQIADQMPQVAILLSNSMRAGLSVQQGVEVVASKMQWPSRAEFQIVLQEIRLGVPIDTALMHLSERVPLDEIYTVISTIQVVRQAGGNLAAALASMASAIMDRQRARGEIKTITSEARFTGVVLLIFPLLMLFILNSVQPGSVGKFLNKPIGWVVMAIFIAIQYGCYKLITKFANVEI